MIETKSPSWRIVLIPIVAAVVLHASTAFYQSAGGLDAFTFGLLIFSLLPYLLCLLLARKWNPVAALGGAVAALLLDAFMYYSVFVAPDSSTAALGLLVIPLVNLVAAVPVGLAVGYAVSRWQRQSAAALPPPA